MRKRLAWGLGVMVLLLLGAAIAATWAPDRSLESLRARWAPPPSQFLQVDGLEVHLRDVGPRDDPTPLVLLHGTGASLHTWEGWVARLSPHHRVITLDLPGFGLTGPSPDGDATVGRSLRLLEALLRKLEVPRCVLGGNSYGGLLAWEYAVAHPEQVARLVLVDAGGYPRPDMSMPIGLRIARTPGLRLLGEKLLPRAVVERTVREVYGDPSKVTPALVDRYFELTLREGNRAALGRRMDQVPLEADVSRLRGLQVPTLILWGAKDRLIPPAAAERFKADLPNSTLVRFEQLGHVPHEEDPASTVAALEAFLAAGP